MTIRRIVFAVASLVLGSCRSSVAAPAPVVRGPEREPESAPTSGLRLRVIDAPGGTTLTVEASDPRPHLIATSLVEADAWLDIPAGFVTIVLEHGDDVRALQLYFHPGAELRYSWPDARPEQARAIEWLDRVAAEREARSNFDALMAAMSNADGPEQSGPALEAALAVQREGIDALGDGGRAHLLRLFHATDAIQITGPADAWSVIEKIPPDSIAWAAYSGRMLELCALFGDLPEARERFEEVRTSVADIGLATAFRACDLNVAGRSAEPERAARAYVAATSVTTPPRVGQPMPMFEFIDVDTRRPVRSQDLVGTPYLLDLWSTWCKPCLAQMKALHELHADVGNGDDPRLRIISVAVNDTRAPVVAFREDHWPMPWTNVWVPDGQPLFAAWSISSVPYAVLVDAEGTVLQAGAHVSFEDARAAAR